MPSFFGVGVPAYAARVDSGTTGSRAGRSRTRSRAVATSSQLVNSASGGTARALDLRRLAVDEDDRHRPARLRASDEDRHVPTLPRKPGKVDDEDVGRVADQRTELARLEDARVDPVAEGAQSRRAGRGPGRVPVDETDARLHRPARLRGTAVMRDRDGTATAGRSLRPRGSAECTADEG
jgi:hypothetical protein